MVHALGVSNLELMYKLEDQHVLVQYIWCLGAEKHPSHLKNKSNYLTPSSDMQRGVE